MRLEVRGRVRASRRADVPALGVRNDDEARRPRVGAHLLERRHPGSTERLEERELRLHADGVRGDRVDHPAAEARAGVRGLRAAETRLARELDRQELGHRVEPDEELAPLPLHGFGEPVSERPHGRRWPRLDVLHHRSESSERPGRKEKGRIGGPSRNFR